MAKWVATKHHPRYGPLFWRWGQKQEEQKAAELEEYGIKPIFRSEIWVSSPKSSLNLTVL
jgi:hypothetical protein